LSSFEKFVSISTLCGCFVMKINNVYALSKSANTIYSNNYVIAIIMPNIKIKQIYNAIAIKNISCTSKLQHFLKKTLPLYDI
ncbi:MAG: hypothetical protein K2K08_05170, partial [Paramuribaculum sp.]|nr:hypothetical protein [Paramuribaculum sp.]